MSRKPSNKATLLASYNRLRQAENKRDELLPDRLRTMKADPDYIEAVFEKNQALNAFVAAARTACASWSTEEPPQG